MSSWKDRKVRKKTSKGLVTVDTLKEGDVFRRDGIPGRRQEAAKRLRSRLRGLWVGIWMEKKLTRRTFEMIPSNLKALIRSLFLKAQGNHHECCSLASVPDESRVHSQTARLLGGCSKTLRYKAPTVPRSETIQSSTSQGRGTRATAGDGRFSGTLLVFAHHVLTALSRPSRVSSYMGKIS